MQLLYTELKSIEAAIYWCSYAAEKRLPAFCLTEDNEQNGHWGQTKEDIEECLGTGLCSSGLIALSVSRCFGPTPGLRDEVRNHLISSMWPEGNHRGGWMEWKETSKELQEFLFNNR